RGAGDHLRGAGGATPRARDRAERGRDPRGGESPPPGGARRDGPGRPGGARPATLRAPDPGRDRASPPDRGGGSLDALPAGAPAAEGDPHRPARRPRGVMSMSDTSSGPNLLNDLAHEFAERYRHGERPSLTEYAERHPELADQIRDLFPALAVMEEVGSVVGADPVLAADWNHVPERLGGHPVLPHVGVGRVVVGADCV